MKYLISSYLLKEKRYRVPYFADLSKHSLEEYKAEIEKCNDANDNLKYRMFEIEDDLAEVLAAEFKNTTAKREAILEEIQCLTSEVSDISIILDNIESSILQSLKKEE